MAKRGKSYHHGNLRGELLAAAMDILDENGVEAVTVREVARRVGVTHAAPANHFADRRALLTALAAGIFETLADGIARRLANAGVRHEARIRTFADTIVAFGLAHPHRFRLLWRRDCVDDTDDALQTAMDAIYDRLVAELSAAPSPRASAETRAIALWSMVQGYVCMRLDGNLVSKVDEETGEPRQKAIVTALLDGIYTANGI